MLTEIQVMAPATSSFFSKKEESHVAVIVAPSGDKLKIHTKDGNSYAGIVSVPQLSRAMRQLDINFNATLLPPSDGDNGPTKSSQVGKPKLDFCVPQECVLRIALSGLREQADALGELLSEAGLYLQHPFLDDFDRDLEYVNPHYLLRPGAAMPKLTYSNESDTSEGKKASTPDVLDEARKSQFLRLFDAANDGQVQTLLRPSERLNVTLKE